MESMSSDNKKGDWFDVKERVSNIRILTEPVDFRQKYFKKLKKSEICYEGCGYAQGASPKFLCYVIDNRDPLNPDGTLKLQLYKMNWTVFEAITNKEKIRKEMGQEEFTFPMVEDLVILKEGKDLDTTYSIELSPANGRYSKEQIEEALSKKDSCEEVLKAWKENTKERHAKEGAPVDEPKDTLPTVQLDEEEIAIIEKARGTHAVDAETQAELDEIAKMPF